MNLIWLCGFCAGANDALCLKNAHAAHHDCAADNCGCCDLVCRDVEGRLFLHVPVSLYLCFRNMYRAMVGTHLRLLEARRQSHPIASPFAWGSLARALPSTPTGPLLQLAFTSVRRRWRHPVQREHEPGLYCCTAQKIAHPTHCLHVFSVMLGGKWDPVFLVLLLSGRKDVSWSIIVGHFVA